jgi:hypothetical protein
MSTMNTTLGCNGAEPNESEDSKKHVSEKKRQANRRNAQKSTGPKSPSGKRWSSQNAFSHGLCAKVLLVPSTASRWGEQVQELLEQLRQCFQPNTLEEDLWVQRLATECWRQQRGLECEFYGFERYGVGFSLTVPIPILLRYQAASNRNLKEALEQLERLKNASAEAQSSPSCENAAETEQVDESKNAEQGEVAAD